MSNPDETVRAFEAINAINEALNKADAPDAPGGPGVSPHAPLDGIVARIGALAEKYSALQSAYESVICVLDKALAQHSERPVLRRLLDHLRAWADEDGVDELPAWLWDDYSAAVMVAGQTDTVGWDAEAAGRGMQRIYGEDAPTPDDYIGEDAAAIAAQEEATRREHIEWMVEDPGLDSLATYHDSGSCWELIRTAVAMLRGGELVTAVELQRRYLEAAEAHIGAAFMPPFAAAVCERWRAILDDLERGPAVVAAKLDWAIKLALYAAYAARNGMDWEALLAAMKAYQRGDRSGDVRTLTRLRFELLDMDTRFGQLGEDGIFASLDRGGVLEHQVPAVDNIEDAVEYPPRFGRARLRGDQIRQLSATAGHCASGWTGIWDGGGRRFLDLGDPLASEARWMPWGDEESLLFTVCRPPRIARPRPARNG